MLATCSEWVLLGFLGGCWGVVKWLLGALGRS